MKVSALIALLQEVQAKHGDTDVWAWTECNGFGEPIIEFVENDYQVTKVGDVVFNEY